MREVSGEGEGGGEGQREESHVGDSLASQHSLAVQHDSTCIPIRSVSIYCIPIRSVSIYLLPQCCLPQSSAESP